MQNEVQPVTNNIVIYQTQHGKTRIDVKFENETVWLTQQQMAELFQSSRTNIIEHIKHIYEEGELEEEATCRNFRQVQPEGQRKVSREVPFYNLDMIISLGYRIKSIIATQFRHYATHGHTAAEVVYERADSDKPFMGLQSFTGDMPTIKSLEKMTKPTNK